MAAQIEEGSLAEFYPDAAKRGDFHYFFAHRVLPDLALNRPFSFLFADACESVTRYLQIRWNVMEMMVGARPTDPGQALRVVKELEGWRQTVAGHPALFIAMPTPEQMVHAYFSVGALLVSEERFNSLAETMHKWVRDKQEPAPEFGTEVRALAGRYFTLERSASEEATTAGLGVLCEWAKNPDLTHMNSGQLIRVTREDFAEAVAKRLKP